MSTDTIVRAVTFPVAEPIGATWQELREALKQVWRDSTSLANWAVTELAKADTPRKPDDKKLKPMPKGVYLYGLAKKGFWGWGAWAGCYSSAQCVLRGVEKKYRKARFDLLWRGSVSLPIYRYPYPYPIHNREWRPAYVEGASGAKVAAVKIRIAGKDFCLRLKSGPEFARQIALFRQLVDGAKRGEASIYQQGSQGHVMVKLVGWFPKPAAKEGRILTVRTDPAALLVYGFEGDCDRVYNADSVRRWIEAHRCFLQRIGEDCKYEGRLDPRHLRNMQQARELRCEKQNNRLDSFTHEVSAMLVGFAQRNGVGTIVYDDTDKSYLPRFPWHSLKTKLAYKCEGAGIAFLYKGKGDDDTASGPGEIASAPAGPGGDGAAQPPRKARKGRKAG